MLFQPDVLLPMTYSINSIKVPRRLEELRQEYIMMTNPLPQVEQLIKTYESNRSTYRATNVPSAEPVALVDDDSKQEGKPWKADSRPDTGKKKISLAPKPASSSGEIAFAETAEDVYEEERVRDLMHQRPILRRHPRVVISIRSEEVLCNSHTRVA
ncbi:hypothetical protein R1sor_022338 [Riccia sorocarpa]|uniref:NT-3 n=1 Tax=Riccia sorocarpa TaxID=122646 RepID=A0ABD3GJJ4_9MARC